MNTPSDPGTPSAPLTPEERRTRLLSSLSGACKAPGRDAASGPESIQQYDVGEEIARGGMGVVLRGRDRKLGREVALKVLREEHLLDLSLVERFIEEAQIGGQLQHPGIVPIYELGLQEDGERPYFAMKLIQGRTLAELLAERDHPGTDRRRFLTIFEHVCQTLAYAHDRRVIHRDLKPENVMVGAFGEVQVVDWGLAKVLDADDDVALAPAPTSPATVVETIRHQPGSSGSQSLAGSVLGTLAYMPPEQARGDIARVNPRSDVFSLGAILCEILTGKPPYVGQGSDLHLAAVECRLDEALRRLEACDADPELRRLARRCLAPAPDARPAHANELAAEISRHLAAAEERAREAQLRAAEERKTRQFTVVLSVLSLLILLGGGGLYYWLEGQKSARRERTEAAAQEALVDASTRAASVHVNHPDAVATLDRALAALERAKVSLATGEATVTTRQRVDALEQQLRQRRQTAVERSENQAHENAMLARLEQIRQSDDASQWEQVDRKYVEAFTAYGIPLDGQDLDASCAAMSTCTIAEPLAFALDHLSLVRQSLRRANPASASGLSPEELLIVAQAADPDEERAAFRAAVLESDAAGLLHFSANLDWERYPPAMLLHLAEALQHANEFTAATSALRRAIELHPGEFELHFALGLQQFEHYRDYPGALGSLKIALALRPESIGTRVLLGRCWQLLGEMKSAEEVLRWVLRADPDNARARQVLGLALEGLQEPAAALRELRRAHELQPTNPLFALELARCLHEHQRSGEALEILSTGAGISSADPELLAREADLLQDLGQAEAAAERLLEAVKARPSDTTLRGLWAEALYLAGDLDTAAQQCRLLGRLAPRSERHLSLLIGIILSRQDLEAAREEARDMVAWMASPAQWISPAMALYHLGATQESLDLFRRALEAMPEMGHLHSWYAWVLSTCEDDLRDADLAWKHAREGARLLPEPADSWVILGAAAYRTGNHVAAGLAFDTARARAQAGGQELERSARVFVAMNEAQRGNVERAQELLDEARDEPFSSRFGRITKALSASLSTSQIRDDEFLRLADEAQELIDRLR